MEPRLVATTRNPPSAKAPASAVETTKEISPRPVSLSLGSPPRPEDIVSAIRQHGMAAMPAVWAALHLPSPLLHADDEKKRAFASQVEHGGPCAANAPCVDALDGSALGTPLPFVLISVNLLDDRETVFQVLAFELDGGAARLVGHLERASFNYAPTPAVRLERIGRAPFIVLSVVHHPASGSSVRREEWGYLDKSSGSLETSLSYITEGAELHGLGLHDQQIEGRIVWTGERGQPAIDVLFKHTYVNTFGLRQDPSSWVPFFTQSGRVSFLFNPAKRRFELDPARSDLTEQQTMFQFDAISIMTTTAPWLMRLATSGSREQRDALIALLDECTADQACASTPDARKLRAVVAGAKSP